MLFQRPLVVVLLFAALLLSSCGGYQKLLKSDDVNKKYNAAIQYYDKGDYARAGTLLEELIPLLRGRPEAEKAQFYFANTNFQEANYTLSAYYFQQFAETYGSSPQAEEARFMYAKSLFRDSPEFELDQTNTYTAIEAIQEFLNQYPESQFRPEAEKMSMALQTKLENKAFESARLYFQLRYNQAAVVAFTTFQQQYPSSGYSEQAAFMKLTAQYEYAKESVEEKQRERYLEAISFYQNFIDSFPQSKNLKAAETMYTQARAEVARLKPADTTAAN